jgi:uncharacterized protein with PhoU and TrkA domain
VTAAKTARDQRRVVVIIGLGYGFENISDSAALSVNMHRALWPHDGT